MLTYFADRGRADCSLGICRETVQVLSGRIKWSFRRRTQRQTQRRAPKSLPASTNRASDMQKCRAHSVGDNTSTVRAWARCAAFVICPSRRLPFAVRTTRFKRRSVSVGARRNSRAIPAARRHSPVSRDRPRLPVPVSACSSRRCSGNRRHHAVLNRRDIEGGTLLYKQRSMNLVQPADQKAWTAGKVECGRWSRSVYRT